MRSLFLLSMLCGLVTLAHAQTTYFKQDFSAGGSVSNYVDAANPGDAKFTGIGISASAVTATAVSGISINNGALESYRPTDQGGGTQIPGDPYATYDVDFSPEPTSFYVQFTLDGLPTLPKNTRPNSAVFSVGNGTDYKADATLPDKTQTFSRIYVNVLNDASTLQWALRWIAGSKDDVSPYYTGSHKITWILNRAGGRLSYLKPTLPLGSPTSETLANGKWDVWVDNTQVFDEIDAINAAVPLLNFKFIHLAGTGYLRLDDFWFRDVSGQLPVTLTGFRAVVNGGRVDLSWQLPAAEGGGNFVVERSRDAREYAQIGAQQAVSGQRYFGHTDTQPPPGQSYYRLRHVGTDGGSTLSNPVAVFVDEHLPGLTILTNPGTGDHLTLLPEHLPDATYQLTTLTGQHLPCQTSQTPDGQVTLLPQHRLPSGVYLLTATSGTFRLTRRVLVR